MANLFGNFIRDDNVEAPEWLKRITSVFGQMDAEEESKDNGTALIDAGKVDPSMGMNGDGLGSQMYGNMRRYINFEEPTKPQKLRIYRQMADYAEIKYALWMVTRELMNYSDLDGEVGRLVIKNTKLTDNINKRDNLKKEWNYVFNDLMKFKDTGHDAIMSFLVSGELIYEKVVNIEKPEQGLKRIKRIRPDNIYPVWNIEMDDVESFRVKDFRNISYEKTFPKSQFSYVYWDTFLQNADCGEMYVTSFLEPVKKVWRQLQLLEEAMVIYRVVRAPERRIFKIATGNMPRQKAEAYVQKVMRMYRQKKIYNTSTGQIDSHSNIMAMMEDYFLPQPADGNGTDIDTLPGGCLTLDTKIPLLDGRILEMKDIIKENKEGKKNWVYSCDPKTGGVVPGPISHAEITNTDAKVMKITLDNGKQVTCTLNHKWPTWNKGVVEANKLEVGDSFIPFNRKLETIKGTGKEYQMVFDNEKQEWVYTHRMVSEFMKEAGEENIKVYENADEDKRVVHHADFNRFNNSPDNLQRMGFKDHYKMHSELWGSQGMKGYEKHRELMDTDEEYRTMYSRNVQKGIDSMDKESKNKHISESLTEYHKNMSEVDKQKWKERCVKGGTNAITNLQNRLKSEPELKEKQVKAIKTARNTQESKEKQSLLSKELHSDPNYQEKVFGPQTITYNNQMMKLVVDIAKEKRYKQEEFLEALNGSSEFMSVFMKENSSVKRFKKIQHQHLLAMLKQHNYKNWKDFNDKIEFYNHKIVGIEYLEETQVVANLTVDGAEKYHDHHTYALDIGVFTKNSNLSEIADIEYFLEKLYRVLEIPINRRLDHPTGDQKYNTGTIGDISWQEMNFSKMVNQIRRKVISVIFDCYKTHLKLKGIWDEFNLKDSDFQVELNQNNYFEEMKRAQIEETRLNAWGTVAAYVGTGPDAVFSKEMAVKQYLKWTEEDWLKNEELRKKEKEEGDADVEEGGGGPNL